jgi:hypothetical protein
VPVPVPVPASGDVVGGDGGGGEDRLFWIPLPDPFDLANGGSRASRNETRVPPCHGASRTQRSWCGFQRRKDMASKPASCGSVVVVVLRGVGVVAIASKFLGDACVVERVDGRTFDPRGKQEDPGEAAEDDDSCPTWRLE